MTDRYSETTDWSGAGWALAVWAAHFSALWGASSIFPDTSAARWIALAATLGAVAVLAMLWRARRLREKGSILPVALGIAALAILLGALPALIG